MDQRADAIRNRLEWFARRQGVLLSDVLSLKFRPLKSVSIPNPTGYMYPGEYEFALKELPHLEIPGAEREPLWRGEYPMGRKPLHVLPSYGNGVWVQHETGLELLLTFDFVQQLQKVYQLAKGMVEITGNPMLLIDVIGLIVGINSGKVPTSSSPRERPENDRYEGHRDVQEIVVEKRHFLPNGTLSDVTIVKIPIGATLTGAQMAALVAKLP